MACRILREGPVLILQELLVLFQGFIVAISSLALRREVFEWA